MQASDTKSDVKDKLNKVNLSKARFHIFLCVNAGNQKCCLAASAEQCWSHLKKRSRDLAQQGIHFARTQACCLRICQQGPLAVVYPGGIWYHSLTPDSLDKIIEAHLRGDTYPDLNLSLET